MKIFEPSKQVEQFSPQVGWCYYLNRKDGDKFHLHESSYNLDIDNLHFGSKIRLAIGGGIVDFITHHDSIGLIPKNNTLFSIYEYKIVDAIILPPLEQIWIFWNYERELFRSVFGSLFFYGSDLIFAHPFDEVKKRVSGNLILNMWVKDKKFISRLLGHYWQVKVSDHPYNGRFGLYEVKDDELVRPIDDYIIKKPLNYRDKFTFTIKEHEPKKYKDKKFTEFYYESAFGDDDDRNRI
jgi:hypothetical protein